LGVGEFEVFLRPNNCHQKKKKKKKNPGSGFGSRGPMGKGIKNRGGGWRKN